MIGKSFPRPNGRAKVTGAARFTVDMSLPGMLHGRILRSPMPHALVRTIDVAAAARLPGVRAIVTSVSPDDPAAATLRYIGAPVAAVAAVSIAAAEEALHLIRVDYQALPFVAGMQQAREADAPAVHDSATAPAGHPSGFPAAADLPLHGNVRGPSIVRRGDVAQGFAQADVVVEGEYGTQVQTDCCMEPHAILADWRADGLTVYMSTQFTAGVRQELAETFGLPLTRVRVVVDAMGGGSAPNRRLAITVASPWSCRAARKRQCACSSIAKRSKWMPEPAGNMAAIARRRQARRRAHGDLARQLRHGWNRPRRRRRQ